MSAQASLTTESRAATTQVERFMATLAEGSLRSLVRNVDVPGRPVRVSLSDDSLPMTRSVHARGTTPSYVVSPRTAYIDYALEELPKLDDPPVERVFRGVIAGASALLDVARVDDIAYVNNFLLSTNLYPPEGRPRSLREMTRSLVEREPDAAIAFRSLNEVSNPGRIAALSREGYRMLPSRQVYLYDARGPSSRARIAARSNTRRDLNLLNAEGSDAPRIIPGRELSPRDFDALGALYNRLYLDKYSRLNPQYTPRFLEAAHRHGWIRFTALRHPAGHFEGVLGTFALGDTITAPIVGYDTSAPTARALYRRLMALVIRQALDERLLLNLSSGAPQFKRLRGAEATLEYTAVYSKHLSVRRRAAWRAIDTVLTGLAAPLLQRYEL